MTTAPRLGQQRLVELDSLRGLAALAVVWFHFTVIVPRFVPGVQLPEAAFSLGHFGVEMFFMISGFVIFMTLNRCKTGNDFIISRASRLYPTFWASVTITFIVGSLWPLQGQHYEPWQYLVNLTMLQELVFVASIDPVYWTLTYELGFYVAMYTAYSLGLLKHIEALCALWIGGALLFHFFPQTIPHPLHYLLVINAFGHLFAAGILLHLIYHKGMTPLRLTLLCCVPLVQWIEEGILAGGIIAGLIGVFWLAISGRLAFLRWRPLVLLGTISYALYVLHHMLGFKLIEVLQQHGIVGATSLLTAAMACILLAAAVTFGIERPAQRLIRVHRQKQLALLEPASP